MADIGHYLRAIDARIKGVFDDTDLLAFGELSTEAEDVRYIKTMCLRNIGFAIGPRDARIKPEFSGKFMVVECLGEPETWAIVGDDAGDLIDTAFDYAADVYGG